MKGLAQLFFVFALFSCKAQTKTDNPDQLTQKFVAHYNNKHYDSVFAMFSASMKKSLPAEKTTGFLSRLQNDAGAIDTYEYVSSKGGFSRYKAQFTHVLFWFDIAWDNNGKISGVSFKPYDGAGDKNVMQRNLTKMALPFSEEWYVFWGGDTRAQNYHIDYPAQKNAFDIVIIDERGRSYKTNGRSNEDYYAFGKPLTAPCDAEVVSVTDGIADNIPGEMNSQQVTGNTVILKTSNNEFLVFAHFKQNSIKVKTGEPVTKGTVLGLCGNSGNSSEPHLHFHIQDKEKMSISVGIKCFFEKVIVNGVEKSDYSPVKGERIKDAGENIP